MSVLGLARKVVSSRESSLFIFNLPQRAEPRHRLRATHGIRRNPRRKNPPPLKWRVATHSCTGLHARAPKAPFNRGAGLMHSCGRARKWRGLGPAILSTPSITSHSRARQQPKQALEARDGLLLVDRGERLFRVDDCPVLRIHEAGAACVRSRLACA